MELQTRVEIKPAEHPITYSDKILLLGSCFAENIGNKLNYYHFHTDVNPFGILYNPLSVAGALWKLLGCGQYTAEDLKESAGKWVSLDHHGSFSSRDKDSCLRQINERLEQSRSFLKNTDWLIITFGTSWVYSWIESDQVVANCHKFPASKFRRFRLCVEQIVDEYEKLLEEIRKVNPNIRILFTVSPIRHWKDGANGNQMSKAILLLAVGELVDKYDYISYFPSYEIVMDELRDYRYYAEDMLHIGEVGIRYIWERFKENYIAPSMSLFMKRIEKINKGLQHRPSDQDSKEYHDFLLNLSNEIRKIEEEVGLNLIVDCKL